MAEDNRNMGTLIRHYRELEAIKNRLVRAGVLNADATIADVEQALRKMVPADAFGKSAPRA